MIRLCRVWLGVRHMSRELLASLLVTLCLSGEAFAQKRIIHIGTSGVQALEPRRVRIVDELVRLGHTVDRDFTLSSRSYNNDEKQLASLAIAVVAEKPDIIYAGTWHAANALKRLTSTIPIVLAAHANLESPMFHIIDNLQKPEANLTGFTRYVNLIPKKLQLIKDAFPETKVIGFVYGNNIRPERKVEYDEVEKKLQIKIMYRQYGVDQIPTLAEELNKLPDDAFLVASDQFLTDHHATYVQQLARVRRPVVHPYAATDKGVLMHYIPILDGEAKAAEYISKLLRGAKVRDLAVQEPQEFDFSVNMTTLRRNGLTMSRDVLARARKVE